MKNFFSKIAAVVVILTIFAGVAIEIQSKIANASVIVGNDYKSTQISATNASTTPIVVMVRTGSFGSLVIASSSASALAIYDATSSTSTAAQIVSFPKGAVAGTYTFDREIKSGIVVDAVPAFVGNYVVTFR